MKRKDFSFHFSLWYPGLSGLGRLGRRLLPTPGNVLFTLLMIALLLWAQSAGAVPLPATRHSPLATSTGTIAYQGRLADADGNPITDTLNMIFRLYDAASGGTPLWTEQWTGSNDVRVSDGLFNVMLGSLTPIPQDVFTQHATLFLGITVGTDDEMTPRVQLGTVPFAVQALTVPDGSVTTAKIADGAVTSAKIDSSLVVNENLTVGNVGATISSRRLEVYDSSDAIIKLSGNQTGAYKMSCGDRSSSFSPLIVLLVFGLFGNPGGIPQKPDRVE